MSKEKTALIVKNKNASRNFKLDESFQAGIVLEGWEVKALRDSKVDELSFFNTELSASEVASLYNGGSPSNLANFTPGPAHWYRMGDGDSAPTLSDSIGNADLTMTNMSESNFVTDVPS